MLIFTHFNLKIQSRYRIYHYFQMIQRVNQKIERLDINCNAFIQYFVAICNLIKVKGVS